MGGDLGGEDGSRVTEEALGVGEGDAGAGEEGGVAVAEGVDVEPAAGRVDAGDVGPFEDLPETPPGPRPVSPDRLPNWKRQRLTLDG